MTDKIRIVGVTDKIRIVGSFGEGAVDAVQEFVKGLDGVQSVSVLVETYPDADSVKAGQGTDGEQASPATPTEPAPAEQTA